MNIEVKRTFKGPDYTIGKMYLDGKYFCDTLEDAVRPVKIKHQTAIPVGEYKVIVNMSPRFGKMFPRLLDVPGFEGVLIHSGNTKEDTSGCILVGENKEKGKVLNSKKYADELVRLLAGKTSIIKIS